MAVITGDLKIDALLAGKDIRWGVAGQVPTVTYSFMQQAPSYADFEDGFYFSTFTGEQHTATQQVFQQFSALFQINFTELVEANSGSRTGFYGQIRLGNNYQGDYSAAYTYLPDPLNHPQAGDVYLSNAFAEDLVNLVPGTYTRATLIHELGHALGLKHPGDYNATGGSSEAPFLSADKDKVLFTVMSYTEHPEDLQRIDLGSYDLLALSQLYGRRAQNTGDTLHRLTDEMGQYLSNLVDDGGIDTLDASAVTADLRLYLMADVASNLGRLENGSAAHENFTLSFDALIENAIGGIGNDYIRGNAANNILQGGAGNDVLESSIGHDVFIGGAGNDVFSFNGAGEFVINDFTPGQDGVNFNLLQYGILNLDDLLPEVSSVIQEGADAVVHFVNNVASITFIGLPVSAITGDIVSFRHDLDILG